MLVVRLDSIGDFLLWLGYATELRERYPRPEFRLVLMVNRACADLATRSGIFDEVIAVDRQQFITRPWHRYSILSAVRNAGAATVISPVLSRDFLWADSAVRASGASRRIGSRGRHNRMDARQLEISDRWYTDLVPVNPAIESELEQNAHFAAGAGVGSGAVRLPDLQPLADAPPIALHQPYCVMVPGAQNPYRRWPIERFAELARMLAEDAPNLEIVLAGSAEDQNLAPPVQQANSHVRDLLGRTNLFQLIGLIADAKFVVSNDTAAVHIAAMLGIPSAVPLGGAQVGRFLPYPAGATSASPIVALHPMPCFGCEWNCIYYDDRDTIRPCIQGIEFAQIWSAVEKLIEDTSSLENRNTAAT